MKKVFLATLVTLMAFHLDCAAQWKEAFNYKGSWSEWSKAYGEILHYEDESGIVLQTSGGLVYFKFQISNYVPPTRKELRAHLKSGEWFTYKGTVEYSVNDQYPTAEAIAKANHVRIAPRKVKIVLDHFQLDTYFDVIMGSDINRPKMTKAQVILQVLEKMNCLDKREQVIMVGDRYYDVLGARETGLSCIGVTYGYGTKEELLKAGAIKTADSTRELGKLLGL